MVQQSSLNHHSILTNQNAICTNNSHYDTYKFKFSILSARSAKGKVTQGWRPRRRCTVAGRSTTTSSRTATRPSRPSDVLPLPPVAHGAVSLAQLHSHRRSRRSRRLLSRTRSCWSSLHSSSRPQTKKRSALMELLYPEITCERTIQRVDRVGSGGTHHSRHRQ